MAVGRSEDPLSAPAHDKNAIKKILCKLATHNTSSTGIYQMKHQMQLLFLIPSQTGFEFQTLRKRFPYDPPLLSL